MISGIRNELCGYFSALWTACDWVYETIVRNTRVQLNTGTMFLPLYSTFTFLLRLRGFILLFQSSPPLYLEDSQYTQAQDPASGREKYHGHVCALRL